MQESIEKEIATLSTFCELVRCLGTATSTDKLFQQLALQGYSYKKSAIRGQLKYLERKFGGKLLDPDRDVVSLTALGSEVHGKAEELLRHYRELFRGMPRRTRIRVGVGMTLCTTRMPAIWARLDEKLPTIDLQLVYGSNMDLHQRVLNGELDFAVVGLPGSASSRDETILTTLNFRPAVVAHRDHEIAKKFREEKRDYFDWDYLKGKTLLIPETRLPSIELPEEVRKRNDINVLPQPSIVTVNAMVAAGRGIGLSLPSFLAPEQQYLIQAMDYADSKEVRFVVRRNLERLDFLEESEVAEHNQFGKLLCEELERIQKEEPNFKHEIFAPEWQAFFSTQTDSESNWIEGTVRLCFYPNDRFVGQFSFDRMREGGVKVGYEYQLEGYATLHRNQKQFNLVACGQEVHKSRGSQFNFSCITTLKEAKHGPILAEWNGARDEGDMGFRPQRGVIVLYVKPANGVTVATAQEDCSRWLLAARNEGSGAHPAAGGVIAAGARSAVVTANRKSKSHSVARDPLPPRARKAK
jgi:DNA-binding transcriptional LysR family regulator